MRNSFIILLLILVLQACLTTRARKDFKDDNATNAFSDKVNSENIFGCVLEFDPEPNKEEWSSYLKDNLQLDSASVDTIPAGTFTVLAQFVIDKKGKLGEISIIEDPGYGLGKRVAEVIAKYKGLWKPAEVNNRQTYSQRRIPITFIVEEENEGCEDQSATELIL